MSRSSSPLRTGDVVTEVLSGDAGLLARAEKNTLFIESSTIAVNTARARSAEANTAGMAMVDAPVSGGVPGAEAATLTFMVGGEAADVTRATPILEAMGRSIVHVGAAGVGQAAKICNNMILGISTIAVAEAFRLADKLGLDANTFNEIVANSSGNCWVLNTNHPVPNMSPTSAANNDYRPGFSSSLMLKDLLLSQSAAEHFGACTPMGARAAELYGDFVEAGNAGVGLRWYYQADRSAGVETMTPKPNIVLILADDMGYSDLGCYGGEIATPNLDRLAANGLRFTQFYNNAVCSPTRASLLTGLYPQQVDLEGPQGNVTIAELLKTAAYRTYMSGKWHLQEYRAGLPVDNGFDRYTGFS